MLVLYALALQLLIPVGIAAVLRLPRVALMIIAFYYIFFCIAFFTIAGIFFQCLWSGRLYTTESLDFSLVHMWLSGSHVGFRIITAFPFYLADALILLWHVSVHSGFVPIIWVFSYIGFYYCRDEISALLYAICTPWKSIN